MTKPYPVLPSRALLDLGTRIALARRARRLTQIDLAAAADVGVSTIASLESGHPGVSLGNAVKVLDAIGLLREIDNLLLPERDPAVVQFAKTQLAR